MEYPELFVVFAAGRPWVYTLSALGLLILTTWLSNFITKQILLRGARRFLAATSLGRDPNVGIDKVITRLAHVVPALVLSTGIVLIPDLPAAAIAIVRNVANAYVILTVALALGHFLESVNAIYNRRPEAGVRPIKGYTQVVKIVVYALATILIIASLIDRSPLILFSGLGAMAAVLMLIFQDTLLSLVASVQLSSNDMVRVGDWIEMPQLNADGDVIDIALHTVKVQNWDKTVTTLPTKSLISESFKNWRPMYESGGRRIKRSLYLDQNSIHFLSEDEQAQLRRFSLLDGYLHEKEAEIQEWNSALAAKGLDSINSRQITNIGTFRAYVDRYLRHHPGINQEMTLMVRQLSPGPQGLPLEIYCFTSTTAWVVYEGVQADIFDHLLAILPEFGLQLFQEPSGPDVKLALERVLGQEAKSNVIDKELSSASALPQ